METTKTCTKREREIYYLHSIYLSLLTCFSVHSETLHLEVWLPSMLVLLFPSHLPVPGPPPFFIITVEGPNSLSFSWDAPWELYITNYIIRCTPQLEGVPAPPPVNQSAALPLTATIYGLAPGVTYNCSVAAMNDVGEGIPAEDTAMTEEIG